MIHVQGKSAVDVDVEGTAAAVDLPTAVGLEDAPTTTATAAIAAMPQVTDTSTTSVDILTPASLECHTRLKHDILSSSSVGLHGDTRCAMMERHFVCLISSYSLMYREDTPAFARDLVHEFQPTADVQVPQCGINIEELVHQVWSGTYHPPPPQVAGPDVASKPSSDKKTQSSMDRKLHQCLVNFLNTTWDLTDYHVDDKRYVLDTRDLEEMSREVCWAMRTYLRCNIRTLKLHKFSTGRQREMLQKDMEQKLEMATRSGVKCDFTVDSVIWDLVEAGRRRKEEKKQNKKNKKKAKKNKKGDDEKEEKKRTQKNKKSAEKKTGGRKKCKEKNGDKRDGGCYKNEVINSDGKKSSDKRKNSDKKKSGDKKKSNTCSNKNEHSDKKKSSD